MFGSYLTYAFVCAGLELSALDAPDAWSSSTATYQVGALARAVEVHPAPCLLVLDEVDRLPRETVELVQRLVEHGPLNLHFAVAFRTNPGLHLAMQVFEGSGIMVAVEDLRFSRSEIDRFFGGELSESDLVAVEERTAGWPAALLAHRNARAGEAGRSGIETARLTANFVGLRLLRGLSPEDRAFVCDQARAAAERRHHDRAFRAALAQQQTGGVALTEAEQRRTFARVVLAALPPLVERTRTLCRQALDRDRDDSRSRRVILGQAPPGPTPPRPAQGAAEAQDAARRDIHRGGHDYRRAGAGTRNERQFTYHEALHVYVPTILVMNLTVRRQRWTLPDPTDSRHRARRGPAAVAPRRPAGRHRAPHRHGRLAHRATGCGMRPSPEAIAGTVCPCKRLITGRPTVR